MRLATAGNLVFEAGAGGSIEFRTADGASAAVGEKGDAVSWYSSSSGRVWVAEKRVVY